MKVTVIPELCSGSDLAIVNAARRSFGVQYDTFRTRSDGPRHATGRSDEELLEDLAKSGHWLPFRHPHMSFECDAPIPVARQLGKHQVGLEWSEVSRRYKTKNLTFYKFAGTWRADVKDRKQGSGELLSEVIQRRLEVIQAENISKCLLSYEEALELGAAPEQCRFLLPQSMGVSWTWTGSLLAFAHLWKMRHHPDTQQETQNFVRQTLPYLTDRFPYAWPLIVEHY
jgi:thymidylate synthase (FAD)